MTRSGPSNLVVATANRLVLTYDVRKLGAGNSDAALLSSRESSLKFQTRCVRASPAGDFLAMSSIEGRVAIDFSGSEASQSYAFKCHRKKEADGTETVFPVHTLAFHPMGTFVTGGGDGTVLSWDARGRKRLAALGTYPNSISALSFSPDGSRLLVASSYDFTGGEKGEKEHPPDALYIRPVNTDTEVKPKAVPAAS